MLGGRIPISLEVEVGSEPIEGSIRVCDEMPRPFRGWLQLSALLQGAAGGAQVRPEEQPGQR